MTMPESMQVANCPVCYQEDNPAIGIFGHKVWYRCVACGIDYCKDTRYAIQGAERKKVDKE